MKHLLSLCLALVLGLGICSADDAARQATAVFRADISCENCAAKILNNVPTLGKGIADVKVDVERKVVIVTYDTTQNSPEGIAKGLDKLNVKAEVLHLFH